MRGHSLRTHAFVVLQCGTAVAHFRAEMTAKHADRLHAVCSQCGGDQIDTTALADGRYLSGCLACGYQWIEPTLRPARDRRKASE